MRIRLGVLLLFATGTAAQTIPAQTTDLPPEVLFLSRALRHIRQATTAILNFTCSETIDRQRQVPPSRRFQRLDLVKLEVAKVGPKELFAWPGAGKFDDKPISDYVGAGLIGDGIYSLFADDIFVHGAASLQYRGRDPVQTREAVRVDYAVNPIRGNFTVKTETGSAVVGYSGSFWVDPDSLDLIRLEIAADDVPVSVGFRSVRMVIEYGAMKAGTRNVLLARSSLIETVKFSGEVSRDEIQFTSCREFAVEAGLVPAGEERAEDVVRPAEPPKAPGNVLVLPGNLTISLRLRTPIGLGTSSVGDAITAVVDEDVRDSNRVQVPKGSLVHGRIRRLERRQWEAEDPKAWQQGFKAGEANRLPRGGSPYREGSTEAWSWYSGYIEGQSRRQGFAYSAGHDPESHDYVLVGLEFTEVEIGHDTARFTARLLSVQAAAGLNLNHVESQESRRRIYTMSPALPTPMFCVSLARCSVSMMAVRESFDRRIARVGYVYITAAPYAIPSDLRMTWKTQAVAVNIEK